MGTSTRHYGAVAALALLLASCTVVDVVKLAGDETTGRDNNTPGSRVARNYIVQQLKPVAEGLNPKRTGNNAYLQPYELDGQPGTNVVAVIPGTDLADEYVLVGAHYDHLGSDCSGSGPSDDICNGATDNAAGVAAVLSIAREIAAQPDPPRRSVALMLWDGEEDGLVGSRYYTEHPLVPLADTVAYVNFDIQGANLLPSLRNTTFAIASETGGDQLSDTVREANSESTLDAAVLSSIFGQFRSDYASFLDHEVASVFFTDATGPCYHTVDDEVEIVDFEKLERQADLALDVVRQLASTDDPPAFVPGTPLATFDDLLALGRALERARIDKEHFSADDQETFERIRAAVNRMVEDGRDEFGDDDVNTLLGGAAQLVTVLTHGECDGFFAP